MTEWTSISVTEEQKAALQAHKPENVAMGKFLVDAIDGDTDTEAMRVVPVEDVVGREVPDYGFDRHVDIDELKAELDEQLDRIESGVREATNAAQSADKKLEDLGR